MKLLFELLTSPLGLPISPLYEWAILLIIGEIAFKTAFRAVGELYDADFISGRSIGSIIHWSIRLVIFVAFWAVAYGVIAIAKFVIANKDTIILIGVYALCMAPVIIAAVWRGKGE